MAQRARIRGKGEPYVEPLFGMCTPKVRWLQDLSGGNRGLSRGPGAIEATSRQSTRLEIIGSVISRCTSGEKTDTNVEGRTAASE
jgi:hypothetical protein